MRCSVPPCSLKDSLTETFENRRGGGHLKVISLRQNILSDGSVVPLAHALLQFKLSNLEELDLKSNRIRERGCRAMCAYARSASVQTIVDTVKDKISGMERDVTSWSLTNPTACCINLSCNFIDRKKLKVR